MQRSREVVWQRGREVERHWGRETGMQRFRWAGNFYLLSERLSVYLATAAAAPR